jgi:quercetin dioxygenase-like cupin family protein
MAQIHTPSVEELERRISRFDRLREMTTREQELAGIPQDAVDIIFARRIMPVILDQTKNPFGSYAPIYGAARTTMFISVMPPGQGPCLHSHNDTYETFMVLEGSIEYYIGDPVVHRFTLNKWDAFSCPPRVYRGFRNVGKSEAVQLTVITGVEDGRDDVSMPDSVAQQVEREHGAGVLAAFKRVFRFDPPRASS